MEAMIEILSGAAITEPVFVQTADDTEYQLIRTAQEAANSGNWIVGECACRWLHTYAKGRTDEQFGELIGLSRSQVQQRRQVWETFGKIHSKFTSITWTHFREALQWDDAEECLNWAEECEATVAEMKAWRRAQRGEDLFADCHSGDTSEQNAEHGNSGFRRPENTWETASGSLKSDKPPRKPEGRTIHRSVDDRTPKKAAEPTPAPVDPEPVKEPESESDPTTVVAMALRKINELIAFVVTKGSESERAELLEHLRPVVESLSPDEPQQLTGKPGQIQASLAVANAVVHEWNMVDGVIRCRDISPKRRQLIQQRMKNKFFREHWRDAIDKIRLIPVVLAREWSPDIEWFLRPDTALKIIEGKYADWKPQSKKGAARIRTQQTKEIKYDD